MINDQPMGHAGSALYPIREVSRLTGVNAVTLRAWERRYGLIRPQRTPKGHRLYAREDIQRVERILHWLDRGVPVSQVRDLLDRPDKTEQIAIDEGDWVGQRQQWIAVVEALDVQGLEGLFNQALALYPAEVCLMEIWQPVVKQLEERWHDQLGAAVQRQLLESFLRTRVGTRLYHANQYVHGPLLLLSRLSDEADRLGVLLLALAASAAGYRIQLFDTPAPLGEWTLVMERLGAAALLLTSDRAEGNELMRRHLPRLAGQLKAPLCLAGPVTHIRATELETSVIQPLGDMPVAAIERLRNILD
ncbi:MerR family transcriptional regulator [Halomonas sp. IOP_31]|uniref:MerR family transcriptional regulator n=1 Tax=Halomonas sp. IOP_31 TaxID=2876584 RepID=UPI001E3DD553|nr:MerR family transcriptional regulator [Halomonas sp. IOP_31]MCD6009316.1 MerR family transcriptional regulator [Halomonas sp. IOP_31]